jgi:L-ascorbate metabolism protein UlaG (beta-lactamase superfamily)
LEVEKNIEKLSSKKDFICWLSHASFLIQLGEKRILIDPVFGDIPFYKRSIKTPYPVEALGKIDYLLISHVHYDHFDKKSIQAIASKTSKAIVPLYLSKILHKTAPMLECKELDWYESYDDGDIQITFVPAKHWGRRGIFDKNTVLWGGYVLSYKGKHIYFSGDTASGDHFEEIGKYFSIDYALLPIGAYKPEFIMKHNHMNPQEALEALKQLGAKKMIPMHYGTFKLTDEPLDEPLSWIKTIDKENKNKIKIVKVGEVLEV